MGCCDEEDAEGTTIEFTPLALAVFGVLTGG